MYYSENIIKSICDSRKSIGYWKVDNKCFLNKRDCLIYASAVGNINITYHFFDHVYGKYDWNKEIVTDISTIYKQRAEQLREKYKYIFLMFSGGSDSTNVLYSFVKNGIPLDEVVTCYPLSYIEQKLKDFDVADTSSKNNMFEYVVTTKPTLQHLSKISNTKITVLDPQKDSVDKVLGDNLHIYSQSGATISAYSGIFYKMAEYVHSKNLENSCILYGIDKPTVEVQKNNLNIFFVDNIVSHGNLTKSAFNNSEPVIEYFYYTGDMPEILIKQAQMLKNYLSINKMDKQIDNNSTIFKNIIYPAINNNIWQAKKFATLKPIATPWIQEDTRIASYYVEQQRSFFVGIKENFLLKNNNVLIRQNSITSKRYKISL